MLPLTEIEKLCEQRLVKDLGDADGKAQWADYMNARKKVFNELLPYIRLKEPWLTDHDAPHIVNVLNNAYDLLGKSACTNKDSQLALTPMELYFLVLSILFHDVGNVFGRKGHASRLEKAYSFAKGNSQSLQPEKRLLFKIVQSHGGKTSSGSTDTIEPLERAAGFLGKKVDCQRIAAVLRFADELAEGPQRTSLFMQEYLSLPSDNQVFHDYSSVTGITIDRGNERIILVYDIEIAPETWGEAIDEPRLSALLNFCYNRMVKLDRERQYNRHYCSLIRQFKKTEVSFHFHHRTQPLEFVPPLPMIVLNDLVLPDPPSASDFLSKYQAFDLSKLIPLLVKQSKSVT